jgi:MraZ protein
MFRGSSNHTLDGKGRIIVPTRFRELIAGDKGEAVMITRLDRCLFAYSLEAWARIEDRIVALSEVSENMRSFRRFFIGGAFECSCDKQGRVLVPQNLREYAGLEKDVVLVGALEHFEIWSLERWTQVDKNMEAALQEESVRNDIAKLGL